MSKSLMVKVTLLAVMVMLALLVVPLALFQRAQEKNKSEMPR